MSIAISETETTGAGGNGRHSKCRATFRPIHEYFFYQFWNIRG